MAGTAVRKIPPPLPSWASARRLVSEGVAFSANLPFPNLYWLPPKDRAEKQQTLIQRIECEDAYKWLKDQVAFTTALDGFLRRRRSPLNYFQFLDCVICEFEGYFSAIERPDDVARPSKTDRDSTAKIARKLLDLIETKRCGLIEHNDILCNLLLRLSQELEQEATQYKNDDHLKRRFVVGLSARLHRTFKAAPPGVIASLASIIDYEPDDRNLRRLIIQARSRTEIDL